MANTTLNNSQKNLLLNSAIGFLGVLLIILIAALATRLIYPRIVSDRASVEPALISNIIQLEVLNGCGIPGLATKYTGSLRRFGFDVVETGNFDHFNVQKSLVISRSGQMENARRIAAAIGISEEQILREESPGFYLDVTLVIGSDYESLNL
ncbi:MAG: LytR C-terminal domain-containing protein [Balneolaceae bacterium]